MPIVACTSKTKSAVNNYRVLINSINTSDSKPAIANLPCNNSARLSLVKLMGVSAALQLWNDQAPKAGLSSQQSRWPRTDRLCTLQTELFSYR